ncbi:MAG: sugar phosphate isomerase/epimerase family protein [Vicinamibacteraceae bacterium]
MENKLTVSDYSSDYALTAGSFHPKSAPGFLTLEEIVRAYGKLGVDGIELNHGYWESRSAQQLRRLVEDAGTSVVCYVFFVNLALPSTARVNALGEAERLLDRTAALGAERAFVVPAEVVPDYTLDQQAGWLVEGVRELAEQAARRGLLVISENIDYPPVRPLMGTAAQCRQICEQVGSPTFRLIYDACAPVFVEEESLDGLRTMFPFVAHVHLKNTRPIGPGEVRERTLDSNGGRRYTGTKLADGVVDIAGVVSELRKMGYRDYIQVEYQGEEHPTNALRENIEYVRTLMAATVRTA